MQYGKYHCFCIKVKHMWPSVVNKVGYVIYIAFRWDLMRIKYVPHNYLKPKQAWIYLRNVYVEHVN